jgi:hypothetical protein
VLHIARQLAAGLAHLHAHEIWHLDVSLANILVADMQSPTPTVVLSDLENSRLRAGDAPSSEFTADFASPERAMGQRCSGRSDVFSLAVVLHALASGAEFPGIVDGVPELGAGLLSRPEMTPTRVASVLHRDLPADPHLASLLALALNHDERSRITMSRFLEGIDALLGGGSLAFPHVLAPLRLRIATPEQRQHVLVTVASELYDTTTTCCNCGRPRHANMTHRTDCTDGSMHLPGNVSPPSSRAPRSLIGDVSPTLLAGLDFRFLYPMCPAAPVATASADGFVPVVDERDPLNLLQLHGGFAVTEAVGGKEVRPPKALLVLAGEQSGAAPRTGTDSVAVAFSAPQPWPSECTRQLLQAGRVHSPIPALLGTGSARSFAWVLPDEAFELANGEMWLPAPDGGFVFLFSDNPRDPHDADRFFAIAAQVDEPPAGPRHATRGPGPGPGGVLALSDVWRSIMREATTVAHSVAHVTGLLPRADRPQRSPLRPPTPPPPAATLPAAAGGDADAVTAPPTASPPAPLLPIAVSLVSLPSDAFRFALDRWECKLSGENGEVGARRELTPALAAALHLPPATRAIATMRCVEAPDAHDKLMTHHGIVAFDTTGAVVAVAALRVACGATVPGLKIRAVIPAEGPTCTEYIGDDAPMPIHGCGDVKMVGLRVEDASHSGTARFFFATSQSDCWHVRRVKVD